MKERAGELMLSAVFYVCIGASVAVGMKIIDWLIPRAPVVIEVRDHG
jgi:hypothetical protein